MPDIKKWINEQLDAGYTPKEIKRSLADSVYDPNLVNEVIAERTTSEGGKNWRKILLIVAVASAIVIVAGSLYFFTGILRGGEGGKEPVESGKFVSEAKTGFSQVDITNWKISGNTLQISLANNAGEDISVKTIYTFMGKKASTSNYDLILEKGKEMEESISHPLPEGYSSGDSYQIDLSVEFEYVKSGLMLNSSGRISGTAS